MLTTREATEAPTQRSRSPLSPTEVTELATVRLFLILTALLCSLRPGFCIVCDFAHARPIMHTRPTLGVQRARCLSVSLSVCQSVSLSVCQSVSLSVCRSVSLSVCLYIYIDIIRPSFLVPRPPRYAQT